MNVKLFFQAIAKFSLGVVLVGALIFLPAGTFAFPSGWLLMGILFVPMFLAGLVMMAKNPDLLKSRLVAKEKQKDQDLVVKLSGLMFIAGFIVAGLDFRFHWCSLPKGVTIGAAVAFLLAYVLYAEVLRENPYLSRTITQRLESIVQCVEIPQDMKNMSPAMKEIETGMLRHEILHTHNSCYRWTFGNVRCAVDGNENKKPMKNKSPGRIDPAVATITAVAVWMIWRNRKPDLSAVMQEGGYHL
jgi:hypothetical protein